MSPDVLDRILATGAIVLDGGLGTELERRGSDLGDPLWSARLLAEEPEAIVATHLAYFQAGAQVATSASYQATFEGFAARGIGQEQAAHLIRSSIDLADEARRRHVAELGGHGDPREAASFLVAASIGPYGAMRADGSEYSGDYGLTVDELRDFHRPRLEVLASSDADLLAFETVPSVDEGRALVELLQEHPGVVAWLSFSCRDGAHTRRGERIEEAFDLARDAPGIVALGINCTEPVYVDELIRRAADRTDLPVIAYPNGGERWDATDRRWSGAGSEDIPGKVGGWLSSGARIVGGCCRVGPETIGRIAAVAAAAGGD
jgi:homocysteine S-methyltransferase